MYGTEKSVVYRPDGVHYGKYITCEDVLKGKADDYIVNLYRVYGDAIDNNWAMARVEVRVPFRYAADVLLDIDDNLICSSLISVDPVAFWSLKMYRAMACRLVLVWQAEGPTLYRETKPALLLLMYIVWLLNGLHSTPDLGQYNRELIAATFPHIATAHADPDILVYGTPTEDEDEEMDSDSDAEDQPARPRRCADAVTLPAIPFGIAQLPDLRVGKGYPVPRVRLGDAFISKDAFHYFMKVDLDQIGVEFFRKKLVVPAPPRATASGSEANLSYSNPPARDDGSDLDSDDNDNPNNLTEPPQPVDIALTALWRQFLLDITLKAPNIKSARSPPYCRLSPSERLLVNAQTYMDPNLASYFLACQWKVATDESWNRIFYNLFPDEKDVRAGHVQNYEQTNYFPAWARLMAQAESSNDIKKMRKLLKEKFDTLYWMPHAQKDRIWRTSTDANFSRLGGVAGTAGPQILIRGNIPNVGASAPPVEGDSDDDE
ncbi:hypothetical protein NLJ89_g10846 [Agrocybe chaxingu]|uniref:Uncharacterized protein n=1 Tax=Agrocybe chaxingu TaxID=84603 RepID=A0A9W8JQC9_9AGAR|nr:hypothetical protein NLJ89_g10846 [Agrocybe chaxingu]